MRSGLPSEPSSADPIGRLGGAIQELFDQLPQIHRRYRTAVSRMHPDDAFGLVDAWTEFHQALTNARYDGESGDLLRVAARPDGSQQAAELPEHAMEIAAELSDAQVRLRHQLQSAETSGPAANPSGRTVLLAR